ncbi:hypothetical protein M407DRAFT_33452 [Tulasnella calospora MUT 4182]|uniref:BTB domain-containing protein n=1 Tax=Tulasnella calospora MUT 4182 TaxID=1051891 RepID=A0A0C3Q2B0_9AGAM|nr:hypothetical protein M407DRAFT_33452 [Tulasnella calospora MUT 4182]
MSQPEAAPDSGFASFQLGLDTELVFKVESTVFGLPRSQLMASEFFRDMLSSDHIGSPEEGTKENPINLEAVTLSQITSFCRILSCRCFEARPELSLEQWSEALHLATIWGFEHIRSYIMRTLETMALKPIDIIQVADACGVVEWLHPAYAKLCAREDSLTAEEGFKLGFRRYAALVEIRESDLRQRLVDMRTRFVAPSSGISFVSGPVCRKECCNPQPEVSERERRFLQRISAAAELRADDQKTI